MITTDQKRRAIEILMPLAKRDLVGLLKHGQGPNSPEHGGPDNAGKDDSLSKPKLNPKILSWAKQKFGDMKRAEAFTKWFGNSKAVDENGEPVVVYHGTQADFEEFDDSKYNSTNFEEEDAEEFRGFYFDGSEESARSYARNNATARVMAVYLRIENPLIGGIVFPVFPQEAKRSGHDGMIRTRYDGTKEYVVFDNTQIKSATGNQGTFDPKNSNINKSIK